MHDDHDKGRESEHKHDVDQAEGRLPQLRVQPARHVLPAPPVGVCMAQQPLWSVGRATPVPEAELAPDVTSPVRPQTPPVRPVDPAPLQTPRTADRRPPSPVGEPVGRVQAQLLQPGLVLSLEAADGQRQPLDVPQHGEAQRGATEVRLGQGQQAAAVQAVLGAEQLHVLAEALCPQPGGHLLAVPAAHAGL